MFWECIRGSFGSVLVIYWGVCIQGVLGYVGDMLRVYWGVVGGVLRVVWG